MPQTDARHEPPAPDPTPLPPDADPNHFSNADRDVVSPAEPKQTVDSIRAAVKTQLDDADTDLAGLRLKRDQLNLQIRDAVQARDEIAKIYTQLQPKTPRTRKPKTPAGDK